jgi:uncharacterized protein
LQNQRRSVMPEYLAPGVYVEEVDTGPKPIEGVSTSTSGMVGVTEWGPVNVPTLVTGFADFQRQFGGYLDRRIFTGNTWYLPHGVEGFFTNGGKRLYVVRILPETAKSSEAVLFNRGSATGSATMLASSALQGYTALLLESNVGIANEDWLRIDDGKFTEYVRADLPASPSNRGVRALRSPLHFNHAAGTSTPVTEVTETPTPAPNDLSTKLNSDVSAGDTRIRLDSRTNVGAGEILRIGASSSPTREFAVVASVPNDPGDLSVTLRHPLAFNHKGTGTAAQKEDVQLMDLTPASPPISTQLDQHANAGTAVLFLANPGTNFNSGVIVRIGATGSQDLEYHVLAAFPPSQRIPVAFKLRHPAYRDHPITEPVEVVTLPDIVAPDPDALTLTIKVPAKAGDTTIALVDRTGLKKDDLVRIGEDPRKEFIGIDSVPSESDKLNNTLTLKRPLAFNHPGQDDPSATADSVVRVRRSPESTPVKTTTIQALRQGESLLMLADIGTAPNDFATNKIVEIGDQKSPTVEYQTLGNRVDLVTIGIKGLSGMSTAGGLAYDHTHGIGVIERSPLLRVQAIDAGAWGNCLQLKVEDDNPILETTATANPNPADTTLTLASTVGIETGTVLEIDYTTGSALRKVVGVVGKVVSLSNSHTVAVAAGTKVRTKEFRLTVECVQMNPVTGKPRLISSEAHRHLSMDPRHSRYVTKVIGAIYRTEATTPRRADGRTEGESNLIRVEDALADDSTGVLSLSAQAEAENAIRLGPDLIWDLLSDGRRVAVGRPLMNGDDAIGDVTDNTYIGEDNVNPRDRKGLFTLKNINEISIVAIPGRTSQPVQQALIDHCELMRYRFAVLDSLEGDGVAELQEQRGLFDSRYAALYYPWLRINDPFPDNPRINSLISIPSSGYMMGIYARSDIERGVHKAPANEVIRGISDLEFKLTKEEQDILNPRNINVLRNFRDDNRGLRVWGARTLSSDPDWKYINVRRLFIFIEKSIDRGTQWVVFESNDEPLWQRVKRVIAAFLTQVWRDGALMGKTPDEAFFVKCDRTTMTQNDIDNGRLIVQVGIAPVKPAEFVIFRIGQWVGGSSVEEG